MPGGKGGKGSSGRTTVTRVKTKPSGKVEVSKSRRQVRPPAQKKK